MASLVYRMNTSLDGFVDHDRMPSAPVLLRHWTDRVRETAGGVYGRRIYDLMTYWDTDRPEWGADERDFADAWRRHPKWVASRTRTGTAAGTTFLVGDVPAAVRDLKAGLDGELVVAGTRLAVTLIAAGLVDAFQLYVQPVVLGEGTPFFAGVRPPLRFVAADPVGGGCVRLTYARAD